MTGVLCFQIEQTSEKFLLPLVHACKILNRKKYKRVDQVKISPHIKNLE